MAEAEILQGKKFKCALCGGSGIQPNFLRSRCIACRGKGEAEFSSPAIKCPSCGGRGKTPGSSVLSCIYCRGIGAVELRDKTKTGDEMGKERAQEMTNRLAWAKKEARGKTKEIEKGLARIERLAKATKKETTWINEFINKIRRNLGSFWKK